MTKKDPGWRPTVMTGEVIQKLEAWFTMEFTDWEACLYAGISESTFYQYCSENPKFSERKELLKRKPRMKAKMNIAESINNKNVWDSKWILEKRDTDYQPTKKIEQEINVNENSIENMMFDSGEEAVAE